MNLNPKLLPCYYTTIIIFMSDQLLAPSVGNSLSPSEAVMERAQQAREQKH